MKRDDWQIRLALAGEFVLGTLHGAARRRFEQTLVFDPALRAEVARWERALYRLADCVAPVTPPAWIWGRIAAEIGAAEVREPAPAPRPELQHAVSNGLWNAIGFWRGWSFAATAVAAVMAVFLHVLPGTSRVTYMVVVTDDAHSRASWVISGHARSNEVRVRSLAQQDIAQGQVFQLWVLPAGAASVLPVGLIPPDGDLRLTVSQTVAGLLANASKFGVSVEPPGGSPTGQPTTTPLYHGTPLAL